MYYNILIPIILTLLVCCGVGFTVRDVLGFWEGFVGTLILQFFTYNIYRAVRAPQKVNKAEELLQDIIDLQTTPVECPCGKHVTEEQVFLNTVNSFNCEKCGSKYSVTLIPEVILQTEQVNLDNMFTQLKEKLKEQQYNKGDENV
jgi:hypothetical protein